MGRKLPMADGEAVRTLLAEIKAIAPDLERAPALKVLAERLAAGVAAVEQASAWLLAHPGPEAHAGASAYLTLFGDVLGGFMLAKGALAAVRRQAAGEESAWLAGKLGLAQVYADHVLTAAPGLAAAVAQDTAALKAVELE